MYTQRTAAQSCRSVAISDKMATAITEWHDLFYSNDKNPRTHAAAFVTDFAATLAVEELELSTGTSARAQYIKEQLDRYVLKDIHNAVQLAAVGGEVILKPFPTSGRILCDVVPADRFYPTRINAAREVEACFFTDYAKYRDKTVVRVEFHDLRPDGYYIHNEAYYEEHGKMSAAFDFHKIPEWEALEEDLVVHGINRPLYAAIRMPFANTVDSGSRLPVSLYSKSLAAFRELDRIYGEFLHEVHSGKRKRIVDANALNPHVPGLAGYKPVSTQDVATDLYVILDEDGNEQAKPFDDYTPELRIEEYQKAMDVQIRMIEKQCGFTDGTFTFDVKSGRMTATQVASDDRDTYATIKAIQDRGMKSALEDLIYIYDVYCTLSRLAPAGKVEAGITFGDSVFEDTSVEFSRRAQLVRDGLLKPEKFVSWYFGISEEEALENYMPPPATSDGLGWEE